MLAEMATIADLEGAHIPERPGHGLILGQHRIACHAMYTSDWAHASSR